MAEIKEKLPPQAIEAEQAILGAMLQHPDALHAGIEGLKEDYFYVPKHRKIFAAIRSLFESSNAVDLITVPDELSKKDLLEEVGGRRYLLDLVDSVVTFANIEDHIRIVIEAAVKNQLIGDCSDIVNRCYDQTISADDILDYSERKIFAIKESSLRGDFIELREILPQTFEQIEEYSKREGHVTGIPTGFPELDTITSGFQKSDLIIIAGRPSMGKTAFALNVAEYVAVEKGVPVCVFSLEMAKEQIAQRLLCSRARISAHQLKTGRIADHQWTNLSIAVGPLSEAPIYLDDSASLTVMEIRAKARRLKLRYDIGMVIVDYLQLVRGRSDAESRQQEMTYVSQSLKALARELKIPVVALSQLSRQVEIRGKDARPQLSDLRESGAIEQDADVVLFIHRPRDEEGHLGTTAEIIIGKQRNGPTGLIKLAFVKDIVRFELLDIHHGSPYSEEQY
ncbi:MAG: replicative DNA helicase [Candidatus Zixiibacteriota bacterium]|nr:MAG: replicative DNA helicase [candidate division Zixibacteria bacterium]